MTIPVGNKAQGVDFFDRIRERESMWELIENTNILFSGPRRLGKTSILAQLEKDASSHEWFAQLIDVQGISTVAEFLAKIEAAFPESGLNAWLAEARKSGSAIADRLKKLEIKLPGGAGAGVELQAAASDWGEAAAQLQARLSECPAIIMVDEFSVFLEKLLKHDQADAVRLLGWLRTWRLAKGVRCRFIFSGSIGLNALVARYGCTSYLNDCYDFRLGPFKPDAAHAMLAALTEREGRQANPSLFAHMCAKVGWLSPYYLNLLLLETMRAARDREDESAGTASQERDQLLLADADDAYERLLSSRARFVHWYKRLEEQLDAADFGFARRLLAQIAQSQQGLTRRQLLSRLQKLEPDPDARAARLSQVLWELEEDGYLDASGERLQFLSFLLRDYWKRNHGI